MHSSGAMSTLVSTQDQFATTPVNSKLVSTTAASVSEPQQTTTSTSSEILQAHLNTEKPISDGEKYYIQVVTSQPTEFEYAEVWLYIKCYAVY